MVLRQVYRAGEKAFVEYAGPTVEVRNRRIREVHEAKVFVGMPAASNHALVDVVLRPSLPDWTASHVRVFEFWAEVPELVIPDNERAAVGRVSRYETDRHANTIASVFVPRPTHCLDWGGRAYSLHNSQFN